MTADPFDAAHAAGKLPHAWLVTGPRGAGKAVWATRRVEGLLGLASGRLEEEGAAHPDFRLIAPPAPGKEIGVEEARGLAGFLRMTASGGWKAAILRDADQMNRNAANALLKLLEEPPARSVLILTASAPGRLPVTVRSRCRRHAIAPPPESAGERARLGAGDPALTAAIAEAGLSDLPAAVAEMAAARGVARDAARLALAGRVAAAGETGRRALEGAFDLLVLRAARDGAPGRPALMARRDAAAAILHAQQAAHLEPRASALDALAAFAGEG